MSELSTRLVSFKTGPAFDRKTPDGSARDLPVSKLSTCHGASVLSVMGASFGIWDTGGLDFRQAEVP
jgi:hypothetical protein